jgi:hypothetical protein
VGNDASSWSPPDRVKTWEDLRHQGFSLIQDDAIGLPEKFRENFHQAYFNNDAVLRRDKGDFPVDRERARDVIYYEWSGSELKLSEYQTIVIRDRAGIKGDRLHKRVEVLADPQAEELVRELLFLIPPERRQPRGTFGINFFRTHTDVVTRPHHDDEEFIILYVMHRDGNGAESYLFRDPGYPGPSATNPPDPEHQREAPDRELGPQVLDYQLNPGEMLIFDDTLFKHGATPLEALPGSKAMRDAVVCSVDYATTYLEWETVG